MLLTAISLIETTLNSHYLKHTKQLHPTNACLWYQSLQHSNSETMDNIFKLTSIKTSKNKVN